MLPLWYDTDGRGVIDQSTEVLDDGSERQRKLTVGHRLIIPEWHLHTIITLMQPIVDHFGIRNRRNFSQTSTLAVFLDAIGLGYLTPSQPPVDCLTPRKRIHAKPDKDRAEEITF